MTGDDCMSKVVACDPIQYLKNFGETDALLVQDAVLVQNYKY